MPKYIVVKGSMGTELGVPFSDVESHADMANRFGGKENVLGAGEFSIHSRQDGFFLSCHGKSVSLEMKSRGKEDARALKYSLFDTDFYDVECGD